MPGNQAVLLAVTGEISGEVRWQIQAVLFLLLLLAVSVCDIRTREIPDSLQLGIAGLSLLCFSPENLAGILGAVPYLMTALFFDNGIGGGDVKLAAATGLVLGLPASFPPGPDRFYPVCRSLFRNQTASGKRRKRRLSGRPLPFGRGYCCLFIKKWRNYFMKKRLIIAICTILPAAVVAVLLYRRAHKNYSVQ